MHNTHKFQKPIDFWCVHFLILSQAQWRGWCENGLFICRSVLRFFFMFTLNKIVLPVKHIIIAVVNFVWCCMDVWKIIEKAFTVDIHLHQYFCYVHLVSFLFFVSIRSFLLFSHFLEVSVGCCFPIRSNGYWFLEFFATSFMGSSFLRDRFLPSLTNQTFCLA